MWCLNLISPHFHARSFRLNVHSPHSTGQPMVVRPPSLATKAAHSTSHKPALATTLDIAIPKGSANSLNPCARNWMNSFTATWILPAQLKYAPERFVASCGQKHFLLPFVVLAAKRLRPIGQHRNIDELVQHFSCGTPHCFIV